MEFKGTKGKWIYDFNGQYCDVFNENRFDNADKIMSISTMLYDRQHNDISDTAENKANAKLIASAPDLLNALKEMILFADFHGYTSSTEINNAKKVLKEALT